ncbi:MAG: class I SAM-dependent methyltransferase [Bacteroidales bacterium]|nr:class I SAM-dependent methyltransferase [Bacteroidales bacterium]
MKLAHDHWGKYYDFVYEQSFGDYYQEFTKNTLNIIENTKEKTNIIDFGAGTGRISIPLAKNGHSVVAVERSKGMFDEFQRKLSETKLNIKIHNCSIADFKAEKTDFALALFTVLSYTVREKDLEENLKNICDHLKPEAYFLFDLPTKRLFDLGRITYVKTKKLSRIVDLLSTETKDIYRYKEKCSGLYNGEEFSYKDDFLMRYWSLNQIGNILRNNGLEDTKQSFLEFNSTGSIYKLYKKVKS